MAFLPSFTRPATVIAMDETTIDPDAAAPSAPELTGPDRPIFVVACPRSGTTLLQLMLHAHPRIAIPPENRFFLDVYKHRAKYGNLRKKANRAALAKYITKQKKYADMKVPAAVMRDAITSGPPTVGSALGIVFREYAAQYGKPRWGDKRPLYLNHIPTLLTLFPDAQIVHIIRDGRDCVASLKRMPWWKTGSISAITRWVQSMSMGNRARRSLRPDQYYEFKYEDLVANPREELEKLCAFLGEEFSEAMLEPSRVAPDAVPEKKTWHVRTQEAVSTASVNKWAEQLEPWEVAVIETLGRRHFKRHGYPLSSGRHRPPPAKLAAAVRDLAEREFVTYRGRFNDRKRAKSYKRPVASLLTSGQIKIAQSNGDWAKAHAKPGGSAS